MVGLERELLGRYPDELSGGSQQRVGIVRALAAAPDILLMDEPFGAVDNLTREKLQAEISRLHKLLGLTTLFVTHDIQEVFRAGSKILAMESGAISQYDTPGAIKSRPANDFVKNLVTLVL